MSDLISAAMTEVDPARHMAGVDVERAWVDLMDGIQADARSRVRRRRVGGWVGAGSLGVVAGAVALLVGSLSVAPLSAAAAELRRAAHLDANSATLPALAAGQTLLQTERISMTCSVSSPSMPAGSPPIVYDALGSVASSTNAADVSTVTITPTRLGVDGSHFATPADAARYLAYGRPFIPCALGDAANQFAGNPANANSASGDGGYATTVSGFGGYGVTVPWQPQTVAKSVSAVNALPSDPTALAAMLAAGEVAPDGMTSSAPRACPLTTGGGDTGCDPTQQIEIIAQLLMVPDASAKLGATLYQVASGLPGSRLLGTVTTSLGRSGTGVSVPLGAGETLQIVIDQPSGTLLGSSVSIGSAEVASVSYGPIELVSGPGS